MPERPDARGEEAALRRKPPIPSALARRPGLGDVWRAAGRATVGAREGGPLVRGEGILRLAGDEDLQNACARAAGALSHLHCMSRLPRRTLPGGYAEFSLGR